MKSFTLDQAVDRLVHELKDYPDKTMAKFTAGISAATLAMIYEVDTLELQRKVADLILN